MPRRDTCPATARFVVVAERIVLPLGSPEQGNHVADAKVTRCEEVAPNTAQRCILFSGHNDCHVSQHGLTWAVSVAGTLVLRDSLSLFHDWEQTGPREMHEARGKKKRTKRGAATGVIGEPLVLARLMPGDVIDVKGKLYVCYLRIANGIGARPLDGDWREGTFTIVTVTKGYFVGRLKELQAR